MATAERYLYLAQELRRQVSDRHAQSGSKPLSFADMNSLVAAAFDQFACKLIPQQVRAIAQKFPVVNMAPALRHPDEEMILNREVLRLALILAEIVPEWENEAVQLLARAKPELIENFCSKYEAFLAEAQKAWDELGGEAAMTGDTGGPGVGYDESQQHQAVLEVYATIVTELRSGGIGNTVNFLLGVDYFEGIEQYDEQGMEKLFAQLPRQSLAVFREVESKFAEMKTAFDRRRALDLAE